MLNYDMCLERDCCMYIWWSDSGGYTDTECTTYYFCLPHLCFVDDCPSFSPPADNKYRLYSFREIFSPPRFLNCREQSVRWAGPVSTLYIVFTGQLSAAAGSVLISVVKTGERLSLYVVTTGNAV